MFKLQTHRDVCSYLGHTNHPLSLHTRLTITVPTREPIMALTQDHKHSGTSTYLLHTAESFLRS